MSNSLQSASVLKLILPCPCRKGGVIKNLDPAIGCCWNGLHNERGTIARLQATLEQPWKNGSSTLSLMSCSFHRVAIYIYTSAVKTSSIALSFRLVNFCNFHLRTLCILRKFGWSLLGSSSQYSERICVGLQCYGSTFTL